jgi:hypothetical protein
MSGNVYDEKVNSITSGARVDNKKPILHEKADHPVLDPEASNDPDDANVASNGDKESQATESTRRSTSETNPVSRLEPTFKGKTHVQEEGHQVTFKSKPDERMEQCCHNPIQSNPITQTKPSKSKECDPSDAMPMAGLIKDLNNKIVEKGASFAQQHLLSKGINKAFSQRGGDASKKERDQLHH